MPIYIVWAYHSSTDGLVRHEKRGRMEVVLVPAETSTMTPMMMMMTTASMATATLAPTPSLATSK